MDTRQMAAMAEATRLTRQGRLIEATALIQQPWPARRRHGVRRCAMCRGADRWRG